MIYFDRSLFNSYLLRIWSTDSAFPTQIVWNVYQRKMCMKYRNIWISDQLCATVFSRLTKRWCWVCQCQYVYCYLVSASVCLVQSSVICGGATYQLHGCSEGNCWPLAGVSETGALPPADGTFISPTRRDSQGQDAQMGKANLIHRRRVSDLSFSSHNVSVRCGTDCLHDMTRHEAHDKTRSMICLKKVSFG